MNLDAWYVTRTEFHWALHNLYERIKTLATQADVDALTAEVQQVASDLSSAQSALQAEIDSLAGGGSVDIDALKAVIDQLDPAVQKLSQLQPTPPAPLP